MAAAVAQTVERVAREVDAQIADRMSDTIRRIFASSTGTCGLGQSDEDMAELTLYRLTIEARKRFGSSGHSAREVSRFLGTSPTQLYRARLIRRDAVVPVAFGGAQVTQQPIPVESTRGVATILPWSTTSMEATNQGKSAASCR